MDSLSCLDLSKSFEGLRALQDLTIRFPPSGIIGLIGPNGAGKTTFLNILAGFVRPDSGHCFIGSREITYLAPHRIALLGLGRTFQDLRLAFQTSVLDNAMLARQNQRGETLLGAFLRIGVASEEVINRNRALQLLKFVGLEEKANDLAGELSYGQQKLLTLACCLATEARILLLDEPVAGVDPRMAEKILGLLRILRDDAKLIVFIEHDISAVRDVADHVIVMDHGKVRAQGPPRDVLERPEIMEAFVG